MKIGKSQLLVCGAAIATYFGMSGGLLMTFQPENFRKVLPNMANNAAKNGLLKITLRDGRAEINWDKSKFQNTQVSYDTVLTVNRVALIVG